MSDEIIEPGGDDIEEPPHAEPAGYAPSVAERFALYQRAGGILTPVLTAVFAFAMGYILHDPTRSMNRLCHGR